MKRIFLLLVACFLIPGVLQAADVPPQVIGSEKYDKSMCIERYTNNCMNTDCLTSEARDCPQKCREGAKDKCAEMEE